MTPAEFKEFMSSYKARSVASLQNELTIAQAELEDLHRERDAIYKRAFKQGYEEAFDYCREAVIDTLYVFADELKSCEVEVNFHGCD